jgi:hypothetical protein
LYWVIGPDGKHHSKDPIPKERAEAQMRALYAAERREDEARIPTAREEEAIERKMEGGGPIPQLSILQQIAKASYSTDPPQQIGPFKLRSFTPTLKFYILPDKDQRFTDTVIVGIRGTKTTDKQDLWADAQLALGKLEPTPRWKKDLADFRSFMRRQQNPEDIDIYGVGHSLGGAILDMFLKDGLIQQGVSYNPAIQLGDNQKDIPNRRIYQDGDPLLAIMGRSAKNVEVRPKKPSDEGIVSRAARYVIPFYGVYKAAKGSLDAHALDNFIGGTHRMNVLKKLRLKDEGYSLTQLAKASGIPRKTLQEVYNRGIGAYATNPTSVRMKGTFKKGVDAPMSQKLSKEQWAMARVYSFIDGNPKHDTDLRGGAVKKLTDREMMMMGPTETSPSGEITPSTFAFEDDQSAELDEPSYYQRQLMKPEDEKAEIKPTRIRRRKGGAKKVCMPKDEYLAEHEQLLDVLAHPSQAKLRKELAKQTAEVKMRGGAGTQPILKRFKKAIRPFLSGLSTRIIAQFNRDYDIVNDFIRNTRGTHRQEDKEKYLSQFIRNVSRMLEGESEILGKPITIDTEDWVTGAVESQFSTFVEGLLRELGNHPAERGRTATRPPYTRSADLSPFAPQRILTAEEDERARGAPLNRASGRFRGGMDSENPQSRDDDRKPPRPPKKPRENPTAIEALPQPIYARVEQRGEFWVVIFYKNGVKIERYYRNREEAERVAEEHNAALRSDAEDPTSGGRKKRGKGKYDFSFPIVRKGNKNVELSGPRTAAMMNQLRRQRAEAQRRAREEAERLAREEAERIARQRQMDSGDEERERERRRAESRRKVTTGFGHSDYLRKARANAKAYGLDPKKLQLGDGKHKLEYDGIGFGLKSYKDFLLLSDEEKAGQIPVGTAEKKRSAYLARATKIKGDWKDNKVSPNNLAIHILWGMK